MAQIFNILRIDVRTSITDIITAKQNDSNSRFLDVYLYDGSTPIDLTGQEVRIYMRKPDGTEIFNNGTITDAVDGRCQFELTSQSLGAVGVLMCEISIWQDNTEILTTQTFDIFVAPSLRSDSSIESSNEYGALVLLFQNLYESMDLMTDMVQNFGEAGEIATERDIVTFWQALEYVAEYVDTDLKNMIEQALANASVSEVLNRLGLYTDTAEAETIFGRLNAVYDSVVEPTKSYQTVGGRYTVSTTTDNKTVVDIAGSGELSCFIVQIYAMPTSEAEARIIVDGETIARVRFNGRSSFSSKNEYQVVYINEPIYRYRGDGASDNNWGIFSYNADISNIETTKNDFFTISSSFCSLAKPIELKYYSATFNYLYEDGGMICNLNKNIEFKEGLQLQILGDDNDGDKFTVNWYASYLVD